MSYVVGHDAYVVGYNTYTKNEIREMNLEELCDVYKKSGGISKYYLPDDFKLWFTDSGVANADNIIERVDKWLHQNGDDYPSDFDVIVIDTNGDPYGFNKSDILENLIEHLEK